MTTSDTTTVHPVDERIPTPRLAALGFQHVLVMYAGAIAVPLIVGRALKLSPQEVALLISADLFCCGLATLIQSGGLTQWFGIRLPVMMGVTFAAVGPMVAIAEAIPGADGARTLFGSIIAAGLIGIVIAPLVSRMLKFFPPVVTGSIIAVIGISLMKVGVGWAMGGPPFLALIADPADPSKMIPNPAYAALDNMAVAVAAFVLVAILLIARLALADLTGRKLTPQSLSAGLRTDGLGTVIGGIFNTFPYTSFSQNVGLVGVTGVRSRFVCVAGGLILIVLGLIPKMAALVESLPTFVLGGAGLVMFGMVAATGIRILAGVDYQRNKHNLFIVAVSVGAGMIPLVAPAWTQHMPHGLHPLLESGILLTSVMAVALNLFFNGGGKSSVAEAIAAAKAAEGGH
jgi:uric acid transporter